MTVFGTTVSIETVMLVWVIIILVNVSTRLNTATKALGDAIRIADNRAYMHGVKISEEIQGLDIPPDSSFALEKHIDKVRYAIKALEPAFKSLAHDISSVQTSVDNYTAQKIDISDLSDRMNAFAEEAALLRRQIDQLRTGLDDHPRTVAEYVGDYVASSLPPPCRYAVTPADDLD